MSIKLPVENPTGDQYSDFIGVVIRSMGYYTDMYFRLRGEKNEILELDVVANPSGDNFAHRVLYEVKKKGYKFTDMFKLYGQSQYLNINQSRYVSMQEPRQEVLDDIESLGQELNIIPCVVPIQDDSVTTPDALGVNYSDASDEERLVFVKYGWYGLLAQRMARKEFIKIINDHKGDDIYDRAYQYERAIHQAFFARQPLDRVMALYQAWQASPNLAGEFEEMIREQKGLRSTTVWDQLQDTNQHIFVQYIMLLEHKARIAIIKNALEYILAGMGTVKDIAKEMRAPDNFLAGMAAIDQFPHKLKIPFLLQVFIEHFGGYLFYKDEEEMELLSRISGIPRDDIIDSIRLLDSFFPFLNGWLYPQKDVLLCMQMMPGILRGTGVFLRRGCFNITNFRARYHPMDFLLIRWFRQLYSFLKPEFGSGAS